MRVLSAPRRRLSTVAGQRFRLVPHGVGRRRRKKPGHLPPSPSRPVHHMSTESWREVQSAGSSDRDRAGRARRARAGTDTVKFARCGRSTRDRAASMRGACGAGEPRRSPCVLEPTMRAVRGSLGGQRARRTSWHPLSTSNRSGRGWSRPILAGIESARASSDADLHEAWEPGVLEALQMKYLPETGCELYEVQAPPMLIDPFLPAGCLGGLSGGPGVGKDVVGTRSMPCHLNWHRLPRQVPRPDEVAHSPHRLGQQQVRLRPVLEALDSEAVRGARRPADWG